MKALLLQPCLSSVYALDNNQPRSSQHDICTPAKKIASNLYSPYRADLQFAPYWRFNLVDWAQLCLSRCPGKEKASHKLKHASARPVLRIRKH